jgi:hypothetical protein
VWNNHSVFRTGKGENAQGNGGESERMEGRKRISGSGWGIERRMAPEKYEKRDRTAWFM